MVQGWLKIQLNLNIHIYICIHIYIYISIFVYIYIYIYVCIYIYIDVYAPPSQTRVLACLIDCQTRMQKAVFLSQRPKKHQTHWEGFVMNLDISHCTVSQMQPTNHGSYTGIGTVQNGALLATKKTLP